MSVFLPEGFDGAKPESKILTPSSTVEVLSDNDKALIRKLFSRPELIPERFLAYIVDYLAVNQPQIPISSIFGFLQFTATIASIATQESTTSGSYGDLTTVGPTLEDLPAGDYVVLWGAAVRNSTDQALMAVAINGSVTGDAVIAGSNNSFTSVAAGRIIELTAADNTLQAKYRMQGLGTAEFYARWLIALRFANP